MIVQRLNCPACGASVDVGAEALRAGRAVCGHCRAAVTIGDADARRALMGAAPADLRVIDQGGVLRLIAPRCGDPVINLREIVLGGAAAVVATALAPSVLPSVVVFLAVGFATALSVAALRKHLPPLVLRDGRLKPSSGFTSAIPVDRIAQLYATQTVFGVPGGPEAKAMCSVYALLADGRRVHMVGPVAGLDYALYIEALLEIRLQIADREVYGQASRPNDAAPLGESRVPVPSAPAERRACDSCGAGIVIDDAARRRGLTACAYCRGLSAIVDASGAPLAVPTSIGAAPRRYEIVEGPSLAFQRIGEAGRVVEVDGEGARVAGGRTVRARDVRAVRAQISAIDDLIGGIQNLANRMAYSGGTELTTEVMFGAGARFEVDLILDGGERVVLLADIANAGEAMEARALIAARLGL